MNITQEDVNQIYSLLAMKAQIKEKIEWHDTEKRRLKKELKGLTYKQIADKFEVNAQTVFRMTWGIDPKIDD